MIDTKAIRSNLLEAAIRGKLTKNSDIDNSAEMLVQIESEYKEALNNCKTKAVKNSSMIKEGTYSLPIGWNWVPLNKLCVFLSRGKSPKYSTIEKYPVFAQKCNQPSGLALEKALFLDESVLYKWQDYFHLMNNDILINSTGTGTMGRVGYYREEQLKKEYPFMVPDSHVTVVRLGKAVNSRYVYYVLKSQTIQNIMENQFRGSTNQKEFYIESVASIPIPLPSKEIQDTLASLIDGAFSALNKIDEVQTQYSNNLSILKTKLINLAIRGKLTEQLPEDGSAEDLYQKIQEEKQQLIKSGKINKVKAMPEIKENEVPFEIPENWKWVIVGSVAEVAGGTTPKSADISSSGNIPYFKVSDMNVQGNEELMANACNYVTEKYTGKIFPAGTTIFPKNGGAALTNKRRVLVTPSAVDLNTGGCFPIITEMTDWIRLYMNTVDFGKIDTGSNIPTVNATNLRKQPIPLPPLAEQERIVEKLNTIISIIDKTS